MSKQNNEEDTLGLKVGSHRENILSQFRDSLASKIETDDIQMLINKHIMEFLEQEISDEKVKFQSQLSKDEVKGNGK